MVLKNKGLDLIKLVATGGLLPLFYGKTMTQCNFIK